MLDVRGDCRILSDGDSIQHYQAVCDGQKCLRTQCIRWMPKREPIMTNQAKAWDVMQKGLRGKPHGSLLPNRRRYAVESASLSVILTEWIQLDISAGKGDKDVNLFS